MGKKIKGKILIIVLAIICAIALVKAVEIVKDKILDDVYDKEFNEKETDFVNYYQYNNNNIEPLSFKINDTGENNSLIVYSELGEYSNGTLVKRKARGRIYINVKYTDYAKTYTSFRKKTKIPLKKNSSCIVTFDKVEYIKGNIFDPRIWDTSEKTRITKFKFDKKEMEINYIEYPKREWTIQQK